MRFWYGGIHAIEENAGVQMGGDCKIISGKDVHQIENMLFG